MLLSWWCERPWCGCRVRVVARGCPAVAAGPGGASRAAYATACPFCAAGDIATRAGRTYFLDCAGAALCATVAGLGLSYAAAPLAAVRDGCVLTKVAVWAQYVLSPDTVPRLCSCFIHLRLRGTGGSFGGSAVDVSQGLYFCVFLKLFP